VVSWQGKVAGLSRTGKMILAINDGADEAISIETSRTGSENRSCSHNRSLNFTQSQQLADTVAIL